MRARVYITTIREGKRENKKSSPKNRKKGNENEKAVFNMGRCER